MYIVSNDYGNPVNVIKVDGKDVYNHLNGYCVHGIYLE